MKNQICTILGGGGFIGRYLVRNLTKKNYRCIITTRKPFQKGYLKTQSTPGAIELLISYLEPLGFKCEKISFGEGIEKVENLYARLGTKDPNICFAGHVDVVPTGDIEKDLKEIKSHYNIA